MRSIKLGIIIGAILFAALHVSISAYTMPPFQCVNVGMLGHGVMLCGN